MQKIMEGGCHCGRVRFRVTANLDGVTQCNCSICAKKGFLHLIVSPQQFQLLSGKDDLTTYKFNTGTAKHTFCKYCGMHPFYVPRSDPDKIDINVCAAWTVSMLPPLAQSCSMGGIGRRPCRVVCPGDKLIRLSRPPCSPHPFPLHW